MTIVLLSLALATSATFLVLYLLKLDDALARIDEQNREIENQRELIEKKETFGAAMESLMGTVAEFEGVLLPSVVSYDELKVLAVRGWAKRWDSEAVARATIAVDDANERLTIVLATAAAAASTNSTGSTFESVIDTLGGGHVATVLDDADAFCGGDVLACVSSTDPQTVHFDLADNSLPYMTDWMRTGIAYHEFAHVLQFTNPEPTEVALTAFDGDVETMADCYALTYLDGWSLDHRVWVSRYQWWDVSLGYGRTCDATQRQAVIDWYDDLGVEVRAVSQD